MKTKKIISTPNAPAAIGPYSQAVKVSRMLFVSGQIGIDPENNIMAKGIEKQTEQAMENLVAVLEAAGSSLESVVKTTVFLKNMDDFDTINKIYSSYFSADFPARCCIEVSKLPKGAEIEIEAIAVCKIDAKG